MRTMLMALALCLAAPATAQTFSMDRMRAETEFGARFDFGFPKDEAGDLTTRETFFRIEFYGQYAAEDWGAYLTAPIARNIVREGTRDEVTAFGNLELGAYGVLTAGPMDFILRGGLTLPTADDAIGGFDSNALSSWGRLTDQVNTMPNTLALRLSMSPILYSGFLFLRGDLGFDFAFSVGDLDYERGDDVKTYFRGNVGLGADTGLVTIAVEFVNLVSLAEERLYFGRAIVARSTHAMSGGLWFNLGPAHPYLAFSIPLDEDTRSQQGFVLTTGIEMRL